MQRALEKLPPGLLEIFHQNIFQWKICLSIKAKLLCVKTNLSTRPQSVAGGLEIQLGNLRTVSPGGCRCRVCDLVTNQPVAGLAMWTAFLTKSHGDVSSMVRGIVSAREGAILHHERCGQSRNVSTQGRTGTQSIPAPAPMGSISEQKWRALGQPFSLFGEISTFSTGKENKKKRMIFSPTLSRQGMRNPKDWISVKRILPGTHRNWEWEPHTAWD